MSYYSHSGAPKGGFSLGKLVGGVAKSIANTVTGGAYSNIAAALKSPKKANVNVQPSDFGTIRGGVVVPTRSDIAKGVISMTPIGGIINRVFPGALNMGPGSVAPTDGQCPKGYHLNKQASPKGPAGSYCVRNRSMNPANGRAIGRAATRIRRGAKQYAKVLRILGKRTGKTVPRGRKR